MPFDDHDDDTIPTPVRKIGIKKNNPTPIQTNTNEIKDAFEKKADAQFEKNDSYKQQIWDLSIKYKSFIQSKVLTVNKGPIAIDLEKEVLDKLVILATQMNEDPTQDESVGSTALCMLLMKCMLLQRDIINDLNFKVDQLSKKIPNKEGLKE